jgi:hypothetical protein
MARTTAVVRRPSARSCSEREVGHRSATIKNLLANPPFGGGGRVCWHPLSELLGGSTVGAHHLSNHRRGADRVLALFRKSYIIDHGAIRVQHPLWSASFEARGLASEDRRPGKDSIRLFASNWIFGHSLGLCYNRKIGTFFVYMTNPKYRSTLRLIKVFW